MSENIEYLKNLINKYEQNGPAKLFYSLNRKAWEMAEMLNSINMKTLVLDDPKDKTFERMRFIINDSSTIANAVKALGEAAGITNDEDKDTKNPKYKITTPESISNVLGNK
jgi:hypothetical protein